MSDQCNMKRSLFSFVLLVLQAITVQGESNVNVLDIQGDIILGGLFPIHRRSKTTENACGKIDIQPGYQYMTAMLFALEQINNSSTLLPNITLGTKIYDTCRSRTIGADRARDIIKYTLLENTKPLVGVVGPFVSDVSIATVPLLKVFGLPQVSYGSTSPDLSNKDLYESFFRTVPPDSFQAEAMVDILKHYGWGYIFIINSNGNYGERGALQLQEAAKRRGICIAAAHTLPLLPNVLDYRETILDLLQAKYNSVNVIVVFTTQSDSTGLLRAAKDVRATRFTWIGSNGWSNRVDVTKGNELIANGSITVNHLEGKVKAFDKYFKSKEPQRNKHNPWFKEFWETVLSCNLPGTSSGYPKNCTSIQAVPNMEMAPVRVVINAVYAFAHALDKMQHTMCPKDLGMCDAMKDHLGKEKLVTFLRNASFPDASYNWTLQFNMNQEMNGNYSIMNFQLKNEEWEYVNIGSWGGIVRDNKDVESSLWFNNGKRISWGNAVVRPPISICSAACVFSQIRKPRRTNPECCWDCINCLTHQIILNDTCRSCPSGCRPNTNRTHCDLVPVMYPNWEESIAISFIVLTCIGIVITAVIGAFFVHFREHPVVKAASRELSAIILMGILLCYAAVIAGLTMPSLVSCSISRFCGSVCYTACYAPLLMKTNRIYRIFTRAKKAVSRPSLVTPKSQVLVTSGLIAVQILLTTVWTFSSPPFIIHRYISLEVTFIECGNGDLMLALNLSYNCLLMLLCTLFAFKTRNFPRNFNEAKYVGITMYLTCSVWIIYLPSYLNSDDTFVKVYLNCGGFLLIGSMTLLGLFAPKVCIILFTDESESNELGDTLAQTDRSSREFTRFQATHSPIPMAREANKGGNSLMVDSIHSGHILNLEVNRCSLTLTETGLNAQDYFSSTNPSQKGKCRASVDTLKNAFQTKSTRSNSTHVQITTAPDSPKCEGISCISKSVPGIEHAVKQEESHEGIDRAYSEEEHTLKNDNENLQQKSESAGFLPLKTINKAIFKYGSEEQILETPQIHGVWERNSVGDLSPSTEQKAKIAWSEEALC